MIGASGTGQANINFPTENERIILCLSEREKNCFHWTSGCSDYLVDGNNGGVIAEDLRPGIGEERQPADTIK